VGINHHFCIFNLDEDVQTALHSASKSGNLEAIKLLFILKADMKPTGMSDMFSLCYNSWLSMK
jgi:ankyrin repeat protein